MVTNGVTKITFCRLTLGTIITLWTFYRVIDNYHPCRTVTIVSLRANLAVPLLNLILEETTGAEYRGGSVLWAVMTHCALKCEKRAKIKQGEVSLT